MNLVTMYLARRATDDGLCEVNDDVPLGQEYRIDLESKHRVDFQHTSGVYHQKNIVYVYNESDQRIGYFFLDLLSLEKPDLLI